MNSIEETLAKEFYKVLEEGKKESVDKTYERYISFLNGLGNSFDNELKEKISRKYKQFCLNNEPWSGGNCR